MPNSTAAFIRRDALPLGMFTKYTWHITNILHVKQIFDTEQVGMACISYLNLPVNVRSNQISLLEYLEFSTITYYWNIFNQSNF